MRQYYFLIILSLVLILGIIIYFQLKPKIIEVSCLSFETETMVLNPPEEELPCNPCFSYFATISHDSEKLLIRNSNKKVIIQNITSKPGAITIFGTSGLAGKIYNPGEDITIIHKCVNFPCEVRIGYCVIV